tara:strand:- start:246 stop:500 length:255 start_codon:yes stop_codon:yes gene_type:complete
MKIRENTPCFLSMMGHNNFWYPLNTDTGLTYIIKEIEHPEFKSWTCGNPSLKALLITPDYLKDVYGNPEQQIVVWVREKDLKRA